jgi:hypothetical protein
MDLHGKGALAEVVVDEDSINAFTAVFETSAKKQKKESKEDAQIEILEKVKEKSSNFYQQKHLERRIYKKYTKNQGKGRN